VEALLDRLPENAADATDATATVNTVPQDTP
jgi:hypothetical protein